MPAAVKWYAINLFNISSERDAEENVRTRDDLRCAIDNFTNLHTILFTTSMNANMPHIQALVNKHIVQLEGVMAGL